ncbi:MAG: exodeoxyribonuclease VII small subunit [Candidatus Methanomethylophilus sp.]|jgi:exodeoxyribonuclease VII small subunit|nr:exodeoxyribonuclease VII small subunit [Methanomethylophilus sp.]MDD3232758.1 exodeoxyribonuclease VII small subunit [Methanomethylophilus sp.]MDD4221806.1 exodeoxyribonuclease VII small subunit [Methanomethylophilus sp.]MDD4668602.1 exodeoxyribonuclease VII small subunit [Methanomethylophilus sp.]
MTNDDVEKMSFEDSMKALEELVAKLEGGELDLDQSLEVYERAIALRDRCRKILDASDRKVQTIMATVNGGEQRADFKEIDG